MNRVLAFIFLVVVGVALFSCKDKIDYEKMRKEELSVLKQYIDKYHKGLEPTSSGLYYSNEEGTGSGDTIKLGDKVKLYYATWALTKQLDSTLYQQTSGYLQGHRYEPVTVTVGLGKPTKGLDEALTHMRKGTHSHLIINSGLAYGQNGIPSSPIGAFQTILMDVFVYDVIPLDTGEDSK